MTREFGAMTKLLVVLWAGAAVFSVLLFGLSRDGLATGLTEQALASPEARAEIAQLMATKLIEEAPLLEAVPNLDQSILTTMNSTALERAVPKWMEHSVRHRLGQDVGPLQVRVSDVVQVSNPVLNLGIIALPAVAVTLKPAGTDIVVPAIAIAAPILVIAALVSLAYVSQQVSWDRALRHSALGTLVGAAVLVALRLFASTYSELTKIMGTAIISWTVIMIVIVAGGATLLAAGAITTDRLDRRD